MANDKIYSIKHVGNRGGQLDFGAPSRDYTQYAQNLSIGDDPALDQLIKDHIEENNYEATLAGILHDELLELDDNDHPQYVLHSIADSKGDILAASAANVFTRLPPSTDGFVLFLDSAEATGLRWGSIDDCFFDYVVSSDGSGTHTTLALAITAAKAAGGHKTIKLCNNETLAAVIDLGGLAGTIVIIGAGSFRGDGNGTIGNYAKYTITAASGANMFTQTTSKSGTGRGIVFRNVGLDCDSGNAIYNVDLGADTSEIDFVEFYDCRFDTGYLCMGDGAGDSMGALALTVRGCSGTVVGFWSATSSAGGPDLLYAYNNTIATTSFWNPAGNGTGTGLRVSGGYYSISTAQDLGNARQMHFSNLHITSSVAGDTFTTGATLQSGRDVSFSDISFSARHNSAKFGNFLSAAVNNCDNLVFTGITGYEESGFTVSGTFLTVDTDWLNVSITNLAAPDWDTAYTGPAPVAPTFIRYPTATDITIVSGAITPTSSSHILIGEGGVDDTLTTINGGTDGQVLLLTYDNDSGSLITFSTSDNIMFAEHDTDSVILGTNTFHVTLIYSAEQGAWMLYGKGKTLHSTFTGLSADDHTQYALLLGRSGGQTLIGGTATGNGLTLQTNSAADNGTFTLKGSSTTVLTITAPTGQLGLPVTGSGAGVLIGGDAQIYRSAADVLATPDSFYTSAHVRVGSLTAPANTTAGDITGTRLSIGNSALQANATFAILNGTITEGTSTSSAMVVAPVISPASSASAEYRTLYLQNIISAGAGIDFTSTSGITSGYFENRLRMEGTITRSVGMVSQPAVIDSSSPATVGTVTDAISYEPRLYQRPSGTSVLTITNGYGILFGANFLRNAGGTITTGTMIMLENPSSSYSGTLTTLRGINIAQFTRGTTNIEFTNAGKMVYTPTTQTLAATSNTIVSTARVIELSNSTGALLTMAATPTIAAGQDGQIITLVNDDSADSIALQDESGLAGSDLRLPGAATLTLGPKDTATFYYNAGAAEWYCIASTNL